MVMFCFLEVETIFSSNQRKSSEIRTGEPNLFQFSKTLLFHDLALYDLSVFFFPLDSEAPFRPLVMLQRPQQVYCNSYKVVKHKWSLNDFRSLLNKIKGLVFYSKFEINK